MSDKPSGQSEDTTRLQEPAGGEPERSPGRRRDLLRAGALVAAGLVIGGATVATVQAIADDDTHQARVGMHAFEGDGPGGGVAGRGPGPGGIAGEQHLEGTLTEATSTSVTVETSSGTDTYQLTDSTQIVRDGEVATAADLEAGDPVLVHVYPSGSDEELVVERIFAGALP